MIEGQSVPGSSTGELVLTPDPSSVRAAREFVRDAFAGAPIDALFAAELLTSELATNAVQHACTPFHVRVLVIDGMRRVEVIDTGRGQAAPIPLDGPQLSTLTGRGLHIVDELASRWGTTTDESHTMVWFELDE